MIDFVGTPPIMKIALCVAMETSKNTISTWIFFEDFFSMKHDTFLILKLLIKFLKELVVGQGLFSAKSPCLCGMYRIFVANWRHSHFIKLYLFVH